MPWRIWHPDHGLLDLDAVFVRVPCLRTIDSLYLFHHYVTHTPHTAVPRVKEHLQYSLDSALYSRKYPGSTVVIIPLMASRTLSQNPENQRVLAS